MSNRPIVFFDTLWVALSHQIEVAQSSAGSSQFIEHAAKCVFRNTLLNPMELFFEQLDCLRQVLKAYLLLVIRFILSFALLIRLLLSPLLFLLLLLIIRKIKIFRLLVLSLDFLLFCDFLRLIFVSFCFCLLRLFFGCILGGLNALRRTQNILNLRYFLFLVPRLLLYFLIGFVEVVFHPVEDEFAILEIKVSHLVRLFAQNFFS